MWYEFDYAASVECSAIADGCCSLLQAFKPAILHQPDLLLLCFSSSAIQLGNNKVLEGPLSGVSGPCLLQALKLPAFDFIKMDIEGAEGDIFGSGRKDNLPWVESAKVVAMELHGDISPGSDVAVLNYFKGEKSFTKVEWKGEYKVFVKNP